MIEYHSVTHSLSLPYGDLVLTDIPAAIVARLVEGDGSCVRYADLFRAAWPNCWRDVDQFKARHNIRQQLCLRSAARDLGAASLFAAVSNVGFSWAPMDAVEC